MELELLLGMRWHHTAMLQFLQPFVPAAFLVLHELDPELILGTLSLGVTATLWQRHPTVERRFWRLNTSLDWWDRLVLEQWDDQQWLQNFCMWKATFLELCAWLAPTLRRDDTHLQPAIPLEKWVEIVLWKLATPDSYRTVGNQFGMGKSTAGALLLEVVRATNSILLWKVGRLGHLDATVAGFAAPGFPNCGGAIDGTHIPIRAPYHGAAQYINRKGYFLMVLQALVDHRGHFTDIFAGQGM